MLTNHAPGTGTGNAAVPRSFEQTKPRASNTRPTPAQLTEQAVSRLLDTYRPAIWKEETMRLFWGWFTSNSADVPVDEREAVYLVVTELLEFFNQLEQANLSTE
jgi:hypothetical protein